MPLTLRPIASAEDARRAILCMSSGSAERVHDLVRTGHLVAPPSSSASSGSACVEALKLQRDGQAAGGSSTFWLSEALQLQRDGHLVPASGASSSAGAGVRGAEGEAATCSDGAVTAATATAAAAAGACSGTSAGSACSDEPAGGAGTGLSSALPASASSATSARGAGSARIGRPDLRYFDFLAEGYGVSDAFVAWVCSRSRGLASWFEHVINWQTSRTQPLYHAEELLGERYRSREPFLRRLLRAWVRHTPRHVVEALAAPAALYDERADGGERAAADELKATWQALCDERACDYGLELSADEPVVPWLSLMDSSIVHVYGSSAEGFTVRFVHPSIPHMLLARFPEDAAMPLPAAAGAAEPAVAAVPAATAEAACLSA